MENVKPPFENLIPALLTLCEQAGTMIRGLYEGSEDIEIIKKCDGSPVTEADHQSHRLLTQALKKITPEIPVISEEDETSWGIKSPLYWLIDPLDGTRGFIHRDGQFCVSIALMKNHMPILGFIHLPLTGETFYGYGATAAKHLSGKTTPIHTRPCPKECSTLLLSTHDMKSQEKWEACLKNTPVEIGRAHV